MLTLKKRAEYLQCAKGKKQFSPFFTLQFWHRPANDNAQIAARFGLTVSRHCGNAVKRNRIKRRLREIVRELPTFAASPQANTDYVLIARPTALTTSYQVLRDELAKCLQPLKSKQKP